NLRLLYGVIMALGFGLLGFLDDYIKVVKKRNLGLTARQKLVVQFVIAALYLFGLRSSGDAMTYVRFPFFGTLQLGLAYYPLCAIGIVYIVNSVNLTDGLDGLASSVTTVASLGMLGVCSVLGLSQISLLCAAT